MRKRFVLLAVLTLAAPLMFYGCSGDDGSTGPQGPPGPPGPPGSDLVLNPNPESCDVCHGVGQIRDVTVVHKATGVVTPTLLSNTIDGTGNLVVTFNIKVDGVNSDAFTPLYRAYVHFDNAALDNGASTVPVLTTGQRDTLYQVSGSTNIQIATLVSNGSGNYTATVPAASVVDNATYLFIVTTGGQSHGNEGVLEADVIVTMGTPPARDLVANTGCASCHGPYPARSKNFPHYAVGGSECQICHSIYSRTMEARTLLDNGSVQAETTARGTNLPEYIHGIHNSHNMVAGAYFRSSPGPGETVDDLTVEERYSVGYPSDMRNCNVCHETAAQQATIAAAPVSYFLCMSCHVNWDGFRHVHDGTQVPPQWAAGDPIFPAGNFHRNYTAASQAIQACMSCHASFPDKDEASDFHNDFQATDAHYDSFYRGEDISFNNPDNVLFAVTGVQKAGDNVSFTWTASKGGAAVNPCNTDNAAGPTFRSLGAYLAYAKGDDWVNENVSATQAPGQPLSARNLFTSLSTTCDNTNVATTTGLTVAAGANAYATKASLAIGGKPLNQGTFLIGSSDQTREYFVRVPSPTYAFNMSDGSAATPRRPAVDTNKCNRCHRGTLYQHGGDRVDNEQLCVFCHNPSSSEKNVRASRGSGGYAILNADNTVNTSATYDGKVAETYDMRYLLHAVHGAEKRENPIIIYRGRGIFAFAPPLYEYVGDSRVAVEYPRPTGWPAIEGTPQPVFGSLENDNQTHTWTTIHYPKPFNDCLACHTGTEYFDPVDQTKAVALTIDAGTSYSSQADDIVVGPTAGACTGCHESTGPAGIPVQRHTFYDFGYKANVAKEVMLEKAGTTALVPAP